MAEPECAELAVVVLAVGEMPGLAEALASLYAQDEPLEIVVVHSATHLTSDPGRLPQEAQRIHSVDLLPTGAARNRGIAATRAPWVAFLAGDSRALPGWARGRLAAHRSGAAAVAAAVVNPSPRSVVAWAGSIVLHHRRWPRVPAREALLYGCSYSRAALAGAGGFRADLAAGEDTELNLRLAAAGMTPAWAPEVRATHPYATRRSQLLREQFERGARSAHAWRLLGDRGRAVEIACQPMLRAFRALRFALHYAEPRDRHRVLLAAPLVVSASRSYARGAWGEVASPGREWERPRI